MVSARNTNQPTMALTMKGMVGKGVAVACPSIADLQVQGRRRRSDLPAYPGAKFNTGGFCTKHDTVRLCKVTDVGKYKKYQILHKVCPECAGHPQDMPLLLDSAALSLSSTQNNPASSPTRRVKKQSTQRHESRSQERIRGGISRTLTGESTNSGEKRGNLLPPPPTRRRRSSSRPRKVVVRKKSPETREGGKISTSSSSKSVDAIMKRITISPPLKDPHKDAVEKQLVIRDDATLPTVACTASQGSEWSQSGQSSSDSSAKLKQQLRDLSGLLLSIQMKDSAGKLSSILQDDLSTLDLSTVSESLSLVRSSSTQPLSQPKMQVEGYNNIRDDASAKYLFRKSKRDRSSSRNRGEKVVAFKEYLEKISV
jgi:hypothetical protein